MQQENNLGEAPQNKQDQQATDYRETQPQDSENMGDGQHGTRQHQRVDAAAEGRFEVGGDPNQMGTHGHPQDESLHNGLGRRIGRSGNALSESSKGKIVTI